MFYCKTVITFAYELGLRRILYRFLSTEKLDLVQTSNAAFTKFKFAKFGPEDRVFDVLSSDVVEERVFGILSSNVKIA